MSEPGPGCLPKRLRNTDLFVSGVDVNPEMLLAAQEFVPTCEISASNR